MGNGGAKKTNQMLGQQTAANNALASNMGGKGEAEYAQRTGLRDEVLGEYRKRLNGEGEFGGGGGGGGYAFTPGTARMNEGMGTAREFMNTGGWTPEQISNERSWSTAPISGLYEGLKNQLNRRAVGSGVGYSGGMGRLARDSAYQMGDQANRTSMGINENVRNNRLAGMGAVGGFDSEFMNREDALRREANSNAASQAASRSSAANNDQAWDMRYLQGMEGLIGNDLPYWDRQQGAINSGTGTINNRVDETPAWQKMAMSLGPSAISAGMGAFTGGGLTNPFQKKKVYGNDGGG